MGRHKEEARWCVGGLGSSHLPPFLSTHTHTHTAWCPLCPAELSSQVDELQGLLQEVKLELKQELEEATRLGEELAEAKEERDSAKKVCCGWGTVGGVLWDSGRCVMGGA